MAAAHFTGGTTGQFIAWAVAQVQIGLAKVSLRSSRNILRLIVEFAKVCVCVCVCVCVWSVECGGVLS